MSLGFRVLLRVRAKPHLWRGKPVYSIGSLMPQTTWLVRPWEGPRLSARTHTDPMRGLPGPFYRRALIDAGRWTQ